MYLVFNDSIASTPMFSTYVDLQSWLTSYFELLLDLTVSCFASCILLLRLTVFIFIWMFSFLFLQSTDHLPIFFIQLSRVLLSVYVFKITFYSIIIIFIVSIGYFSFFKAGYQMRLSCSSVSTLASSYIDLDIL